MENKVIQENPPTVLKTSSSSSHQTTQIISFLTLTVVFPYCLHYFPNGMSIWMERNSVKEKLPNCLVLSSH